ncbi:MAG: methyltransferase domain-containing protein [Wenzhouxiangellaceae bacterium]|nr:methyltransferase domain-containing protein [Wenzhouxiangellaceae bacterium]
MSKIPGKGPAPAASDGRDNERFENSWLQLRRAADQRARSEALTKRAAQWLQQRPKPPQLVDLGAGGGNNLLYLAARLPGPQRWLLIDHDAALLDAARRAARNHEASENVLEIKTSALDLGDLAALDFNGVDLVCASALFDLVSADWVEGLAERCRAAACAVLFTLSVDGHWRFIDARGKAIASTEDAWASRTFNAHQRRDKGLGPALGADAPAVLARAFRARNYQLHTQASPWRIEAGTAMARSLGVSMLEGRADALAEQAPADAARLAAWMTNRRQALQHGTLGVEIGHIDLFASP